MGKCQRGFVHLGVGVKGLGWSLSPFDVLFNILGAQGRAQVVSKLQVYLPLGLQRRKAELAVAVKRLAKSLAGHGRADLIQVPYLLLQS